MIRRLIRNRVEWLGVIPNLKIEVLGTVMCKGLPRAEDFAALDILADKIKEKHAGL